MPRIAAPISIDRFVEDHLGRWSRLADLVARASGRVSRLEAAEVLELGVLYRAATSDLAIAQRDFPADVVTTELNDLVAATHALVYSEAPTSAKRLRRFVVEEVPATVRANMRFVLASAVLLFGPALVTFVAGLLSPDLAMGALPATMRDQLIARRPGTEIPENLRLSESPVIIVNNVRIAVVAAAGGLTAGLLTAYILVAYVLFDYGPGLGTYSRRAALVWLIPIAVITAKGLLAQRAEYATKRFPVVTTRGTFYDDVKGRLARYGRRPQDRYNSAHRPVCRTISVLTAGVGSLTGRVSSPYAG